MTKNEIKDMMKKDGQNLRTAKIELKEVQRGNDTSISEWKKMDEVQMMKWHNRHKHIAYSMLKGRPLEEIENYCREDNKPNLDLVEKYKAEWVDNA